MLSGTRLQISQLLKTRNCRQLYTPRGRSPGLSLSGEELRGLSSNLTFFLFLSPWDFHSLVGRVPFFVVHSQARFHDSMMHACMNGNGPPIRVAGDTANLEIIRNSRTCQYTCS